MKLSILVTLACLTATIPACAHYPLNDKLERYESPYAASRAAINSTNFKEEFLNRNVTRGLTGRGLNPINWFRLASIYFSRTDLEAEYFDDLLFHGATYKELDPLKGPDLIIQATDIVDGYYFSFSRLQFGIICSNLSSYPIARAVAASASLPGPFTAITLRNYAGCRVASVRWSGKNDSSGRT